jgi:hypothetical protein
VTSGAGIITIPRIRSSSPATSPPARTRRASSRSLVNRKRSDWYSGRSTCISIAQQASTIPTTKNSEARYSAIPIITTNRYTGDSKP